MHFFTNPSLPALELPVTLNAGEQEGWGCWPVLAAGAAGTDVRNVNEGKKGRGSREQVCFRFAVSLEFLVLIPTTVQRFLIGFHRIAL